MKDANPDQIIAAIGAAGLGALWVGRDLPLRREAAAARPLPTLPGSPGGMLGSLNSWEGAWRIRSLRAARAVRETAANLLTIILLKLGAQNRPEAAKIVRNWHDHHEPAQNSKSGR